jgi:hypothetical protein
MSIDVSRREFVKLSAIGAMSLGIGREAAGQDAAPAATQPVRTNPGMFEVPFEKKDPRIGMIGMGARGSGLLNNLLAADAKIVAVCDLLMEKTDAASATIEKSGQKAPAAYNGAEHAFEQLVKRDDIDLVIAATPWRWHVEMAVAAMQAGKHAAVEVPAAISIEDCWRMVDVSEQTRRHCIMLENCCYGYNETLVLRMCRAGLLGEILYGEGAYLHDIRAELFNTFGNGLWRRAEHTERNGNLYPTHGLGPVANYLGIQRGDRFAYMVSMSTPERGLSLYRQQHLADTDPRWAERYVTGDLNTSLIKTAKGMTITVKHDVSNPHPYDRINVVGGTKGVFADYPPRLYLDGQPGTEDWTNLDAFKNYAHPLWKNNGEIARKLGGHGGMDYIELYRLLQCFREGLPPDMDVYDAAAWSAVGPLSVASVARGSAPVEIPDFTRGGWQQRPDTPIATM